MRPKTGWNDLEAQDTSEQTRLQADQIAEQIRETSKETLEKLGIQGSLGRVSVGGVRLSAGLGVSAFGGGVVKSTIEPDGDVFFGSNVYLPETMSFGVFANDQAYNAETMEEGDILIGNNSDNFSNVKWDASEGQIQFRLGTTVNVYMDTDGTLKAGAGAVVLDQDGIGVPDSGDAITFSYGSLSKGTISFVNNPSLSSPALRLLSYTLSTFSNQITNGDFETGSLSSWTENDPSNHISISNPGDGFGGGYAAHFTNSTSSDYITQNTSSTCSHGVIVKFRAKTTISVQIRFQGDDSYRVVCPAVSDWRTFYVPIYGSVTSIRIDCFESGFGTGVDCYIDDIEVLKLFGTATPSISSLELAGPVSTLSASQINLKSPGSSTAEVLFNFGASRFISVNPGLTDMDVYMYGTVTTMFHLDASTNRLGVAKNNPSYTLDVGGTVNVDIGSTYKINGVDVISATATGRTQEEIEDFVGAMVSGNTETGIAVTYDDTAGKLNFDAQTAGDARYAPIAKGVTNGDDHDHAGGDGAQISYLNLSNTPVAETNSNDIFRCDNPGGASAFVGTINGTPSGASVAYNITSGQEAAMVPNSTSQLAKMRLYNTTRGNSALISNCNTGTNTITLTANAPASWASGDTITIASQTVSGGGFSWVDVEITSGPTGKSNLFVNIALQSATAGQNFRIHPFTASFSVSKYVGTNITQVAGISQTSFGLIPVVSNVFSLTWDGTPSLIVVRESGYLS